MYYTEKIFLLILILTVFSCAKKVDDTETEVSSSLTAPPYSGTIFINGEIINDTDPSIYQSVAYQGQSVVQAFDRRTNSFNSINAHVYTATYSDSSTITVRVNPEFSETVAATNAARFAGLVGKLPAFLRASITTISVQGGKELFGGGGGDILIHVDQADEYGSIIEEVLVHEATHVSVDAAIYADANYTTARDADNRYISDYAQEFPTREDASESILLWYAVRYKADRLLPAQLTTIQETIPNRIAYYDLQNYGISP